uniref:Uncharacterized protein n=1 Tax=Oryza brachyantha TaxID=4533 RepID=J3MS68_ORYBR
MATSLKWSYIHVDFYIHVDVDFYIHMDFTKSWTSLKWSYIHVDFYIHVDMDFYIHVDFMKSWTCLKWPSRSQVSSVLGASPLGHGVIGEKLDNRRESGPPYGPSFLPRAVVGSGTVGGDMLHVLQLDDFPPNKLQLDRTNTMNTDNLGPMPRLTAHKTITLHLSLVFGCFLRFDIREVTKSNQEGDSLAIMTPTTNLFDNL